MLERHLNCRKHFLPLRVLFLPPEATKIMAENVSKPQVAAYRVTLTPYNGSRVKYDSARK